MCSHIFFLCLVSCLSAGRLLFRTNSRVTFPSLKVCWSLDRDNTECMAHTTKNWCLLAIISSLPSVQVSFYLPYLFIFIIIATGICLEVVSLRCACMKKWKWFLSGCLFFSISSENSFGHRCCLCKLKVSTVRSEPIPPTHYVRYSSVVFLRDPESSAQCWVEAQFGTVLVFFLLWETEIPMFFHPE